MEYTMFQAMTWRATKLHDHHPEFSGSKYAIQRKQVRQFMHQNGDQNLTSETYWTEIGIMASWSYRFNVLDYHKVKD